MLGLVVLAVIAFAVLALPLLIVRVALHVLFALLFLPFKIVGLVFRIVAGVVGLVFRILFSVLGVVFGLLAAVVFLVLVPLLPLLLIGLAVWLVARHAGPSRRALRIA